MSLRLGSLRSLMLVCTLLLIARLSGPVSSVITAAAARRAAIGAAWWEGQELLRHQPRVRSELDMATRRFLAARRWFLTEPSASANQERLLTMIAAISDESDLAVTSAQPVVASVERSRARRAPIVGSRAGAGRRKEEGGDGAIAIAEVAVRFEGTGTIEAVMASLLAIESAIPRLRVSALSLKREAGSEPHRVRIQATLHALQELRGQKPSSVGRSAIAASR